MSGGVAEARETSEPRAQCKRPTEVGLYSLHQNWLLGGQGLDLGRQTALVTSSLVLVEHALVGDRVDHGLSGLEQVSSLGLVTSDHGLLHVLDDRAEMGTQCRIGSVELDVLASALEAR